MRQLREARSECVAAEKKAYADVSACYRQWFEAVIRAGKLQEGREQYAVDILEQQAREVERDGVLRDKYNMLEG